MFLVQPYVQGVQQQVNAPLFDPRHERDLRERFGRPAVPELRLANSLYVSGGRWPARAWVLVRRGDYNLFNLYATNFQLVINDLRQAQQPLTFKNLAIVQARCVSRGVAADPDAVYLVELTDRRGVIDSPWFSAPTESFYNVLAPAYSAATSTHDRYYQGSLNSGTPWDWNGMVGDLWGQLSLYLGPYPGLPVTPEGTPEGFTFIGVSCWEALNKVLCLLGLSVAVDLTNANPYTIVQGGAADANFAALTTLYAGLLEDDMEWVDGGSGRVPGSVVVYGHRRNEQYGTEETVRRDLLQWSQAPFYSVTVPAPAAFSAAAGQHHLWVEMTVRFDADGNPNAADATAFAAVAAERVTQYYQEVFRGTQGYMRRTYAGALPFATGSLVDGVCWHMDFTPQRPRSPGEPPLGVGWRTELVRMTGNAPAWEEVARGRR